jgi:membrane protein YdbS with pleckstrin-like domain
MMRLDQLPNQRPGEKVALFLRRFWFAPAAIAAMGFVLIAVPAAVFLVYPAAADWFAQPILGPLLTLVCVVYVLGVWLICSIEFVDYYLDTWIVTSERIINIEQLALFRRTASELHLANIQDITSEVKGPLHTFFNYGDVLIQTAAEQSRFNFHDVPDPEHVKDVVLKLVEEDKKRHAAEVIEKPAE